MRPVRRVAGRGRLAAGVGLTLAGVLALGVQLALGRFGEPWYLPILSGIGVLLVVRALALRPTLTRLVALVVTGAAFAGGVFLAAGHELPAYTGMARSGRPFPAFAAERADGTLFSHDDLRRGRATLLVFYRGHW